MYDYPANRSDELTIHRKDVIKVIFKDGPKWWFGENTDGKQGYFPMSYVTTTGKKSGNLLWTLLVHLFNESCAAKENGTFGLLLRFIK